MDKQAKNNRYALTDEDRRLEMLFDVCRPEPIDNARIKSLVRGKIMREKLERMRRRRRVLYGVISAAASVAVLVVLAFGLISPKTVDLSTSTLAEVQNAGYQELIVAPGKRAEISLPDGSRLIANACTRVLYPEKFEGDERRIFADGEVYLEVSKDKDHPFVVESDGFEVRVLGTVFNICNSSDSTASVVLVEGSVEVTTESDRNVRLKPNDMVSLANGDVTSLQQVDPADYTSWIDGLLSLQGKPLSELAASLSHHYGVELVCDSALSDVKVYGKLDLTGSVDQVLMSIREIVPMEIEREGTRITMKSVAMK